ncbi:hypothetical protein LIA77_11901 [Sarocladium implicatum]|nr:hypothetical protein LIA77_11901 [Sarocladium implicatum]
MASGSGTCRAAQGSAAGLTALPASQTRARIPFAGCCPRAKLSPQVGSCPCMDHPDGAAGAHLFLARKHTANREKQANLDHSVGLLKHARMLEDPAPDKASTGAPLKTVQLSWAFS